MTLFLFNSKEKKKPAVFFGGILLSFEQIMNQAAARKFKGDVRGFVSNKTLFLKTLPHLFDGGQVD